MQLSDRIQMAVDDTLFSIHKVGRMQEEKQDARQALIYSQLDQIYKDLKTIKEAALRIEAEQTI